MQERNTFKTPQLAKFVWRNEVTTVFAFAIVRLPVWSTRKQSEVLCWYSIVTACRSSRDFTRFKSEFSTAVEEARDEAGLPQ